MVITDLDGTLLDKNSALSDRNRAALEQLGDRGVPRVVATGRSPHSAHAVLADDCPIDYLVFSTGVGVIDWATGAVIRKVELAASTVDRVRSTLLAAGLDFMVHASAPDNHHFEYHGNSGVNPDFVRRCERYAPFARPGDGTALTGVSQFLAVEPPHAPSQFETLRNQLPEATVVLATSPLDHESRWIEIFAPEAGKGRASAWLAARLGVDQSATFGIGNDYNDRGLLKWVQHPFVVANAPDELLQRYPAVASHDADGFAQFVEKVLA